MIPGPPDAPEIFIKSVSPEEFVIEWGEPRIFAGVKVRGYQVTYRLLKQIKSLIKEEVIQIENFFSGDVVKTFSFGNKTFSAFMNICHCIISKSCEKYNNILW